MSLFSLSEMMDRRSVPEGLQGDRLSAHPYLLEGMSFRFHQIELRRHYALLDFEFWARKNVGDDAVEYLKKNIHPLDRLPPCRSLRHRAAERRRLCALNWSLRISLANLPDEAYEQIGRAYA